MVLYVKTNYTYGLDTIPTAVGLGRGGTYAKED